MKRHEKYIHKMKKIFLFFFFFFSIIFLEIFFMKKIIGKFFQGFCPILKIREFKTPEKILTTPISAKLGSLKNLFETWAVNFYSLQKGFLSLLKNDILIRSPKSPKNAFDLLNHFNLHPTNLWSQDFRILNPLHSRRKFCFPNYLLNDFFFFLFNPQKIFNIFFSQKSAEMKQFSLMLSMFSNLLIFFFKKFSW